MNKKYRVDTVDGMHRVYRFVRTYTVETVCTCKSGNVARRICRLLNAEAGTKEKRK